MEQKERKLTIFSQEKLDSNRPVPKCKTISAGQTMMPILNSEVNTSFISYRRGKRIEKTPRSFSDEAANLSLVHSTAFNTASFSLIQNPDRDTLRIIRLLENILTRVI